MASDTTSLDVCLIDRACDALIQGVALDGHQVGSDHHIQLPGAAREGPSPLAGRICQGQ